MKDLVENMDKQIKEKEDELQRLKEARKILEGKTPSEIAIEKYRTDNGTRKKRKIKNTRWTDVEERQLINLYNSLDMDKYRKISRIAGILKMPKQRVYGKLWTLKKTGFAESQKKIQ